MGHLVTQNDIATSPDKVNAIRNLKLLNNIKEPRRCLGTASWYHRFIFEYIEMTQSFKSLLRKELRWSWGIAEQATCEDLKRRLTEVLVLACHNFDQQFGVQTDASNVGLGGVLSIPGRYRTSGRLYQYTVSRF